MKIDIPCKVGDTVYFLDERIEKIRNRKVVVEFVNDGTVDQIIIGGSMEPQVNVCDKENNWSMFDVYDFGKIVFLSRIEAEKQLSQGN